MSARACAGNIRSMARYLLRHRHQPRERGVVFASFEGHQSPLRDQAALASCHIGGHEIWWTVQAETDADAARLLSFYVAQRTTVTRVGDVQVP